MHAGPQHARIHAAFRLRGEPVHVAMGAGIEKGAEMLRGLRDRSGIGHGDAIETKCARFVGEGGLQAGGRELGGCVQKSRST